jgi:hypothetical protein
MLDKLIPYIVCWCKTLYQTLPVAGTNRITLTIATRSDTGSHNRLDLIQSLVPTHYVCNTIVSNHFHSVKSLLISSARPRDFDGMLGTGLPVSMYTTKTPIDMRRFNVLQLK